MYKNKKIDFRVYKIRYAQSRARIERASSSSHPQRTILSFHGKVDKPRYYRVFPKRACETCIVRACRAMVSNYVSCSEQTVKF